MCEIVLIYMKCYIFWSKNMCEFICPFPMLAATGSFSPERGLPVKVCVDFNHFKSIIMSALLHSKTSKCSFMNTLGCSFTCYQRKCNLLKSSLWICHLKMIEMYRTLDRKSTFTYAATWWSSTLESGECRESEILWGTVCPSAAFSWEKTPPRST